MNFGADWHGVGAIDDKAASSLLDLALERGVNLIDTADIYGRGAAEEMLGRLLKGRREKILLATKVLGTDEAGRSRVRRAFRALDRAGARRQPAPAQDRPCRPLHAPRLGSVRAARRDVGGFRSRGSRRQDPGPRLLEFLRRTAGGSLAAAGRRARFEFDQVQYSLVARFAEADLVPAAVPAGVSLLAWSPLAGGLLTGKYAAPGARGRRESADAFPYVAAGAGAAAVEVLRRVAELEGATPAQAALGWIMGKPFIASAVVGARTPAQLEEALGARPLSARGAALLDRASALLAGPRDSGPLGLFWSGPLGPPEGAFPARAAPGRAWYHKLMTGMEMYMRFMLTLTIGLVGVGVLLMTLLETLLHDWDPVVDLARWWRELAHSRTGAASVSAEDILSELEGRRQNRYVYAARPPARSIDRRREVLRDMRSTDPRVSSPEFV